MGSYKCKLCGHPLMTPDAIGREIHETLDDISLTTKQAEIKIYRLADELLGSCSDVEGCSNRGKLLAEKFARAKAEVHQ